MKAALVSLSLLAIIFGILKADIETTEFSTLSGPYLGQQCPARQSEVFLDGMISTLENPEMCAAFTEDGKEFYFNRLHESSWAIFFVRETDGGWTSPEPIGFSSNHTDRDFTISPDGRRIHFGSNRPRKPGDIRLKSLDIYVTERRDDGAWGEPVNLGAPINTDLGENYPSVSRNGNLYFFSCREDGLGGCDIYLSRFMDGRYLTPVNLGPAINSEGNDWDAFIAPDESYIIFSSQDRQDTNGKQDLYISFRNEKGSWSPARNMGPEVNSVDDEICPSVSLDGKHLFFTSRRRGQADIFWIDASIIERLESTQPK